MQPVTEATPVNELHISVRSCNALINHGIRLVGDLLKTPEVELLRIPNIGRGTLAEIRVELSRHGFALGVPRVTQERMYPADMSLRDYFAAQAMPAILTASTKSGGEKIARMSYLLADAMLKERTR